MRQVVVVDGRVVAPTLEDEARELRAAAVAELAALEAERWAARETPAVAQVTDVTAMTVEGRAIAEAAAALGFRFELTGDGCSALVRIDAAAGREVWLVSEAGPTAPQSWADPVLAVWYRARAEGAGRGRELAALRFATAPVALVVLAATMEPGDPVTEGAVELLGRVPVRDGHRACVCDGLVHHTDTVAHARECAPLRALVGAGVAS